jgi:hypothetical protein
MTKLRISELFTFLPGHSRKQCSLEKLSLPAMMCIVCLFCAAAAIVSPAQIFTEAPQLRRHGRRRSFRVLSPRRRWELLWDNHRRRRLWQRHGIQNHPKWHVDHAVQLYRRRRWRRPCFCADPSQRRGTFMGQRLPGPAITVSSAVARSSE